MATTSGGMLAAVSDELAAAVEAASRSVVAVHGRRRIPATGIVWREGGIVVTADHVLERDEDITISVGGGDSVAATLAGRDPGSDIAVLKLADSAPEPATLPPAGTLKVGNLMLAFGAAGSGGSGRVIAGVRVVSGLGTS